MASQQIAVRLVNLSTGYSGRRVGEHYDLDLPAGSFTVLIGVNGAGKSTLLKTICGDLRPVSGGVEIFGDNIDKLNAREISKLVSVVLTDRIDVGEMTVRELVELGRSPYTGFRGRLSSEDEIIVDRALAMVGIESLAQRRLGTLSDGERQKALVAKSLAQQTPVILFDEPTAFLDLPSRIELLQLLSELCHNEGKTVILSTHDISMALQMADYAMLIDSSRRMHFSTPAILAKSGAIASTFALPDVTFDASSYTFVLKR